MKRTILFLIVGLSILSCTRQEQKKEIYLVLKTLNNPFFKEIERGVIENMDTAFNLQVRAGQDESDLTFQKKVLSLICQSAENSNVAGLILAPCSSGGDLIKYLKKLSDLGIPIILVDTRIDTVLLAKNNIQNISFIGSSNYNGGVMAGEFALKSTELKDILLLNGVEGQESAEQRNKGFKSVFDSMPSINIEERTANWNRSEAQRILSAFIISNKEFDCIFAANDEMALGALRAYKTYEVTVPIIIGFDGIDAAKQSIKNNELFATIVQDPYKMGEASIKQILDFHFMNNSLKDSIIDTKIIYQK